MWDGLGRHQQPAGGHLVGNPNLLERAKSFAACSDVGPAPAPAPPVPLALGAVVLMPKRSARFRNLACSSSDKPLALSRLLAGAAAVFTPNLAALAFNFCWEIKALSSFN